MGSVVIILIVLLMLANSAKKPKKNQAAPRRPATGARQVPPNPARATSAPAKESEASTEQLRVNLEALRAKKRPEPVVRAVEPANRRQGEAMLRDDACLGGSMEHTHTEGHGVLADDDCFGGSMEHTHTEGVSRADHARRMAAIDAEQGEDDPLVGEIDARALRRAVVMAEVLGKPRALKRY